MDFEMPTPGPMHAKLDALCGHFKGEETMMPSPWSTEPDQRTAEIHARTLDGFFVISDYEQRNAAGESCFRGHGVYSWDPGAECYRMYWFDSMGGAGGVAEGRFEGNVLTFQNTSPMGHHRYRYTFEDGCTTFEMSMSQDGQEWQSLMVGRYRPA